MTSKEVWRLVDGTPYQVSSFGRVRRNERLLSARVGAHGYLRVCLSYDGEKKDAYIHRLVCRAFHGAAPTALHHAHHMSGVRSDNCESNLCWLSPQENRALRNHARGEQSGASKITTETARSILSRSLNGEKDTAIALSVGLSRRQVADIRLRKSWRHIDA